MLLIRNGFHWDFVEVESVGRMIRVSLLGLLAKIKV